MNNNKILLYQYGKVGSSSIRKSIESSKYVTKPLASYSSRLIQTHSHSVAEDIIKKHPDVLVIVIVRLPVTRNLSDFWENIRKNLSNYKTKSIEEIDVVYKQKDFITYTDNWMNMCFKTLDIDKSTFEFNHLDKYTLNTNKIKTLLLRYEDMEYVTKSVLPEYGIHVNKKTNVSSKKGYGKFFLNHKEYHTIDKNVEDQIRSSPFNKIFYTEKELSDHIEEWSESSNIPKKSVRFAPLPPSIKQQAARQQSTRQQSTRQQAARQQSTRQQAARQQAARQQAARQQAARRDVINMRMRMAMSINK